MTLDAVDVIIPAKNQSPLVLRCIQSLRSQSRLNSIILVDDGSEESEREILSKISGIRYFRHNASEGFVKSVLHGARKSDAPYMLILNSDTEAYHSKCIEEMAKNLDDGAAICGAMLLYPKTDPYRAETIQHCGVYWDGSGFPRHIMSGFPANTPMAQVRRRVPAVTGACLMISHEWWEKAGRFDDRFGSGVFEDMGLCITVGRLKGEIIYEPKALFAHYEHASQDPSSNWFSRDHVHKNFQYLMLKYGQQPPSDEYWFKGL